MGRKTAPQDLTHSRTIRVFVEGGAAGQEVRLGVEEVRHLFRVLRLRAGARVTGFDGEGREFPGVLSALDAHTGRLRVTQVVTVPPPELPEICLAPALIRPDAFEWVIQKATELGADRLLPLVADHCSRADARDGSLRRRMRWERIARESLKQCCRNHRLQIAEPVSSRELLRNPPGSEAWLCHPAEAEPLLAAAVEEQRPMRVVVAVGPEGGWSEEEVRIARAAGFRPGHLGRYVLRAETAALAALSLVMSRWRWR